MAPHAPVSIKMVAKRAGVSTATVSNVLNGKSTVSKDYVDRVRAAVEDLGYVADSHASRLRSGRHSLAGVVVPDLTNPMFAAFVSALERLARDDGFDLLVVSAHNAAENEAERLNAIRSWRPSGLIVIPCDGALSARLPKGGHPPIVAVDRIPDDDRFDLIAVDNARSAAAITAHLEAEGCRSCLVAGSSLGITNVRERWEGVTSAARSMSTAMLEASLDPAVIAGRLRARLADAPRPDALFALDHVTTLIAYRVLGEMGLSMPRDIAFASFDETEWMTLVTPAITAVRQPVEEMAQAAWHQLLTRMSGEAAPARAQLLTCAIEIRGSTLRHNGKPTSAAA